MSNEETVSRIVDLYTSTRMSVRQFEDEVRRLLSDLPSTSPEDGQAMFDKGFSAGYDQGVADTKENF